jgi:hypothetical protein
LSKQPTTEYSIATFGDAHWRSLLENSREIIDLFDLRGRVTFASPAELVARLKELKAGPLEIGSVLLATKVPLERRALKAIRELGLEYQLIFNRDAVMLLPPGVNKRRASCRRSRSSPLLQCGRSLSTTQRTATLSWPPAAARRRSRTPSPRSRRAWTFSSKAARAKGSRS